MSETEIATVIPKSLDDLLTAIGSGKRPWFLKSTELYSSIKEAVSSIPQSKESYEKVSSALVYFTEYINKNTSLKVVPLLDIAQVNDLLLQADSVLSDALITLDDSVDSWRLKLTNLLRDLIAALIRHKKFVQDYLAEKATAVSACAKTYYEKFFDVLAQVGAYSKERYPETYDKVFDIAIQAQHIIQAAASDCVQTTKTTVDRNVEIARAKVVETQTKIDTSIQNTASAILKKAQPYVHQAVNRGQPIFAQAVEISQPYVIQAKPYFDPLVEKASSVNDALKANEYIGPYMNKALATAGFVLEEAKAYCIMDDGAADPAADPAPADVAPSTVTNTAD